MDHVSLNSRGFTLIEFLVAIVILMVGLLGLLQTVNYSLNSNMQNQLRNEALLVADSRMADELAKSYDAVTVSPFANYTCDHRRVLNTFKNFSVARGVTEFQYSKEIRYEVSWRYKGVRYIHNSGGLVSKAQQ